uniref:Probable endolytic peptidoglycan transglycosylase RlpA n=1 Tax=Fundidesulfovibrio putealis TaxID=270496 RepID=A0A7C4AHH0_9BACT
MCARLVCALLACLLFAACTATAPKPAGKGTFRPYTIKGKTYHPLASGEGFREEGVASWYEPGWFSGNITANGERLRSGDMTCAHKILPINTMVHVTNLENGRQITVRVNDRGPFVSGRCIDLTPAGAQALGFYGKGYARVRLNTQGEVPGMRGGQMPGPFYVQVGAFAVRENAQRLVARLERMGFAGSRVQEGTQSGQRLWRVQAGEFATLDDAQAAQDRLDQEFSDAFVLAQ